MTYKADYENNSLIDFSNIKNKIITSLGGGGGSGGGSVIQTTAPGAALAAGEIGARAAQEAADLSTKAINNAMNAINIQYQQARYAVQPYREAGVQALDQLNQYLGLSAYNPGVAPTAPVEPTIKSLGDAVTKSQLRNYVIDNSVSNGMTPGQGQKQGYVYQGAGSGNGPVLWGDSGPNEPLVAGSPYPQAIRDEMAADQLPQAEKEYQTALTGYNQDKAEYDQNLAWYNQYQAQGPLTAQQITDKITNLPGYQAQQDQGIDAIGKSSSAAGYLGSGRALKELMNFGQNTLSTFYGNELSRLAGIAGMGQQAATQTSNLYASQGNNLAGLNVQLGEDQANAALAAGNSRSQAEIAANQQFQTMGGSGGGANLSGIGSILGGIGSLASAFSSKELKEKISTPSTKEILENIDAMSLDKWKYKGIDQEFIGPYAEEFSELFGVGDSKTINMVDVVGVLLGAVKELSAKVNKLEGRE